MRPDRRTQGPLAACRDALALVTLPASCPFRLEPDDDTGTGLGHGASRNEAAAWAQGPATASTDGLCVSVALVPWRHRGDRASVRVGDPDDWPEEEMGPDRCGSCADGDCAYWAFLCCDDMWPGPPPDPPDECLPDPAHKGEVRLSGRPLGEVAADLSALIEPALWDWAATAVWGDWRYGPAAAARASDPDGAWRALATAAQAYDDDPDPRCEGGPMAGTEPSCLDPRSSGLARELMRIGASQERGGWGPWRDACAAARRCLELPPAESAPTLRALVGAARAGVPLGDLLPAA